MQALILAAGMGKRLKELTNNHTKCMVKVNGTTLIERMLTQLDRFSLERIVIVTGYKSRELCEYIDSLNCRTPICFVDNPIYDKTNNIYSLWLARDWLCGDDTLLLESDLIFEDSVLEALISDPRDTLALVAKYEAWMDGTCVVLGENDSIAALIPKSKFRYSDISEYYKTVNIYKFGKQFSQKYYVPFLDAYQTALGVNEYYEQVLRVIAALDKPPIYCKKLSGQRWYEVDDVQDLDIAESMFSPENEERLNLVRLRRGGYWRYPSLLDFSYAANPHYPGQKMKDELRASFDVLLTNRPSGTRVTNLLAAKNFGVHQQNIAVGNGASELLKAFISRFDGTIGFVQPTFEEIFDRAQGRSSAFVPRDRDRSYSANDLMEYFSDKGIDLLVFSNPDIFSGSYIPKAELLCLIEWAKTKEVRLLIDESLSDFADEPNNTLIEQELLEANSHLYVIKSISRSHGIPGLRLGFLASGDESMIADIKADSSLWNINSFAEYFMQIEEKYHSDHTASLAKLRSERERFSKLLDRIDGIRVIPSQSSSVTVELSGAVGAGALMEKLLVDHNILAKAPEFETGEKGYMRFAVRSEADNDRLIAALRSELGSKADPV